jgi:hypothetical protein
MNLKKLQDTLRYYVIDADYCTANHIDYLEVINRLKQEIKSVEITLFTDENLIADYNFINNL